MQVSDIKRILILGSGHMGQQIGYVSAAAGFEVVLYDIDEQALQNAMDMMAKLSDSFVKYGKLNKDDAAKALDMIEATTDPEKAGKKADFVSESVPEDPDLKGRVFAQFNEICPENTVFTTNTSTLLPSMFAEQTGRPDRLLAFHFHNVLYSNVVDVMPHPGSSSECVRLTRDLAEYMGLIPIVLERENHGYVFNAMFEQLLDSALTLAVRNVASIQDIDRSWMGIMGMSVGPFGLMDGVGLDTVWRITDYWAKQLQDKGSQKKADFLKQYVDQGLLGTKTGQGFYTYPHPEFAQPGFVENKTS